MNKKIFCLFVLFSTWLICCYFSHPQSVGVMSWSPLDWCWMAVCVISHSQGWAWASLLASSGLNVSHSCFRASSCCSAGTKLLSAEKQAWRCGSAKKDIQQKSLMSSEEELIRHVMCLRCSMKNKIIFWRENNSLGCYWKQVIRK